MRGTVRDIADHVDSPRGTVLVRVDVDTSSVGDTLRPGMSVRVRFNLASP